MTDNTDDFAKLKEEALSRLGDFVNFVYDDRFAGLFTESEDEILQELASSAIGIEQALSDRYDYADLEDEELE